jgi:hypothetical protein
VAFARSGFDPSSARRKRSTAEARAAVSCFAAGTQADATASRAARKTSDEAALFMDEPAGGET